MTINNHIPSQHQFKQYFNNFHKGADTEARNHLKGSFRGRVVALLRQAEAKHDNTVATVRKLRQDVRSFVNELRKTSPLSRLQEKSFKIIYLPSSRTKSIESLSAFIKESRKKLDDRFSFAPGGRVVTLLRQAEVKHDNTVATVRKLRQDVRSFVSELRKTSPLSRLQEKSFEAVSSSSNRTNNIKFLSAFIRAAFELQKVDSNASTLLSPTDALDLVEKATTRVQDYLKRQHKGSDFGTKLCELVSKDSEVKKASKDSEAKNASKDSEVKNPSKDSEAKKASKNPSKNPSDAIEYLSSKNNQMLKDKKYIRNILNKLDKNIESTYDLIRNRGIDKESYKVNIMSREPLHELFSSNLERQADKNGVFLNIGEMLQKYPEVSEGETKKSLASRITLTIMERLPTQRTELLAFVREHLPPAGEGESDAVALRKEEAAATLISKILAGKCDETTIGNHVVGKRSIDKLQALIDDAGYRTLLVSGSASLPSSRTKSIESLSAFIKESRKKLDDRFSFAPGGRVVALLRQAEAKHDNTVATVRKLRQDVRSFVNELRKTSPLSRLQEKNFEAVSSPFNRTKSIELLSRFIKVAAREAGIHPKMYKLEDAQASVKNATTRVQDCLKRQHKGSDFGTKLCELVSKDSEVKKASKNPSDVIEYLSLKNIEMLEDNKYIINTLNKLDKNIESTYNLIRNRGMDSKCYRDNIMRLLSLGRLFGPDSERQADKNGVILSIDEMLKKLYEIEGEDPRKVLEPAKENLKGALVAQIIDQITARSSTQRTELLEFVHEHLPPAGEGESDAVALRKEEAAATLISKILAGKCDETTIGNHVVGKRSIDKLQALIDDAGYRTLLVSGSA